MKKLHLIKKEQFTSCTGMESGGDNKKNTTGNSNNEKIQEIIDATVNLGNDIANIYGNPKNLYNYYSALKHTYKLIKANGEMYEEQMSATGSVTYTGTAGNPITIKDPEKGKDNNKKGK